MVGSVPSYKINLSIPSELITVDQIIFLKFPLTEPVHLRIGSKSVNFQTSRFPLHPGKLLWSDGFEK